MFSQKKPKQVKRTRPQPLVLDLQRASIHPGYYGHMGREPNTNYEVQLFEYKNHEKAIGLIKVKEEAQRLLNEKILAQGTKHTERKIFEAKVRAKVEEKLKQYDKEVEIRQQKLKQLFCEEERIEYAEVIDKLQKAELHKLEELKKHNAEVKANREAERLKVLAEKRFELFRNNCPEFRPAVYKYNLIESKNVQLQQMKEKQDQKEAERELDRMWHQLLLKELRAKEEREKQEHLRRYQTQQELLSIWEKQIEGQEKLRQEEERIEAENKEEIVKLQDKVEKEYLDSLEARRRKKEETARELTEQIEVRRKVLAQMKQEEDALEDAFSRLNRAEVEKERRGLTDTSKFAKKETAIYRESLRELEKQRKEEDRMLDELLIEHRKAIEAKQDEARCKLVLAKRKLQQDVIETVAQQLEYKRQNAENELKMKEAENELLRIDCEIYERNRQEAAILEEHAAALYREDLRKQIEENGVRKQKECEELQRQLQVGLEEEERYKRIVENLIRESTKLPCKHPFATVLETKGPCPRFINK